MFAVYVYATIFFCNVPIKKQFAEEVAYKLNHTFTWISCTIQIIALQNCFYRTRIYYVNSLKFMSEKTMSFPIIVCYKRTDGSLYVHLDECQEINNNIGFRQFNGNDVYCDGDNALYAIGNSLLVLNSNKILLKYQSHIYSSQNLLLGSKPTRVLVSIANNNDCAQHSIKIHLSKLHLSKYIKKIKTKFLKKVISSYFSFYLVGCSRPSPSLGHP